VIDADYKHQETQDAMSDEEIDIRHIVLEGNGKEAVFKYTEDGLLRDVTHEGWIVDMWGGKCFVWSSHHGYRVYTLREVGVYPQYICTGCGDSPIGYAKVTKQPKVTKEEK